MAATGGVTFICFLISFLLLAVPTTTLGADKPIELKMSVQHGTKGGKYVRGHLPWSKLVEKATEGKVKVTLFPANSLAKAKENYDAMLDGIVDIGWIALPHYPGRFPYTELYTLPAPGLYEPITSSIAAWRMYKEIPEIQKEWSEIKLLFFHGYIPMTLATMKKPVRVPADVKGMKVRAAGKGITSCYKAAGASPLFAPPSEIFLNLQKGVVQGAMIGWEGLKSFGVTKLAEYYTEIPAFSGPLFAMCMSKKKWDAMPADVQKAMWSVCGDFGAEFYGKGDSESSRVVVDELNKQKKVIVQLKPEEMAQWNELAEGVRDKMLVDLKKKGLKVDTVYPKFQKIVKEVTAK